MPTSWGTRSSPRCSSTRSVRVNIARFVFLDLRATQFYIDWPSVAHDAVALLRAEAGRDPYDRGLSELIGELSTRSEEFPFPLGRPQRRVPPRRCQALPPPARRGSHPDVRGALELPADPGQTILACTAEPNSPSLDALNLLASWTSTPNHVSAAQANKNA